MLFYKKVYIISSKTLIDLFFMEMLKSDFRNIFFYEFKLGSNAAQTIRNVNIVWGEGSFNIRTVQRCIVQFRSGNSSLEDEPHGSRPCAINNNQLKVVLETDPRKSVRVFAEELNVDPSIVSRHLADIGKSKS